MGRLAKFLATGFGVGYVPKAPGTAGTVLGLALGLLPLTLTQPLTIVAVAVLLLLGVWICGAAETAIGRIDPSCVVLDEILAMWLIVVALPEVRQHAAGLALAFAGFRLFDIAKPPPLRLLARLPGGWGIMLDDLGAAGYTVIVLWLLRAAWRAA